MSKVEYRVPSSQSTDKHNLAYLSVKMEQVSSSYSRSWVTNAQAWWGRVEYV